MKVEPEGTLGTSAMVTDVRCGPITGANRRPMLTKARAGRMGRTKLLSGLVDGETVAHKGFLAKSPQVFLIERPKRAVLERISLHRNLP
jgi:hypothetical protein